MEMESEIWIWVRLFSKCNLNTVFFFFFYFNHVTFLHIKKEEKKANLKTKKIKAE